MSLPPPELRHARGRLAAWAAAFGGAGLAAGLLGLMLRPDGPAAATLCWAAAAWAAALAAGCLRRLFARGPVATCDADGLCLAGPWTRRRYRWEEVRAVELVSRGTPSRAHGRYLQVEPRRGRRRRVLLLAVDGGLDAIRAWLGRAAAFKLAHDAHAGGGAR